MGVTATPVGGHQARHIPSPHSCQNHPAGLWSTADGNRVCCLEAAGRSPVTASDTPSTFSEVSSAPAAVASSMGTGRAQAAGAPSSSFSLIQEAAIGEQVKDAGSVVCSAHTRSATPTCEADRRRTSGLDGCLGRCQSTALLALNAAFGIRSTESSAAAKCATALATESVAGGRRARHIPGLHSCQIPSSHSCQDDPAGLWSTADANRTGCLEAVGRSWSVLANGAWSPFASDRRSVLKEGRVAMRAPVLLFLTANRVAGSRRSSAPSFTRGRVARRAAVQPSITGMDPGGRRPTVPGTLVDSDRSRRVSAGAQVLFTRLCRVGGEGEHGAAGDTADRRACFRSRRSELVTKVYWVGAVAPVKSALLGVREGAENEERMGVGTYRRFSRVPSSPSAANAGMRSTSVRLAHFAQVGCSEAAGRTSMNAVQRGAQRPAGVLGTVGLAKKATTVETAKKKVATDSDSLGRTFYIDVVTAGKADEKFDVLEIASQDGDCTGAAELLSDGNDERIDREFGVSFALPVLAEVFQSEVAQNARAVGGLVGECYVGSRGGSDVLDQDIQRDISSRVARTSLGHDGIGNEDSADEVLFEQQRVAVEQTSIFSESRYGATVEKKVSALQLGHCDQVAARALSSGKRSVPSIPSATSSSCILRNEALWALISAHSSGVTGGYGEAPLLDAPLLETMSSSLAMPQIVAPALAPSNPLAVHRTFQRDGVFVPMSTMNGLASTPTSGLDGHGLASTGTSASTQKIGVSRATGSTGQHRRCGRNDPSHPSRANRRQRTAPGFAEGAVGKTGNGQAHAEGALSASFLTVLSGLFLDQDSLFLDGCLGRCKSTALQLAQRKTSVATGRYEVGRTSEGSSKAALLETFEKTSRRRA
jgi:hypothetical protein